MKPTTENRFSKEKPRAFAESPVLRSGGEGCIKVHANDRLGWKVWVWVQQNDTVGRLKELLGAKMGKDPKIIRLQK